MLIFGMHIEDIVSLKSKLNANFDMKDLRNANHILGTYKIERRLCFSYLRRQSSQSILAKCLCVSIWQGTEYSFVFIREIEPK